MDPTNETPLAQNARDQATLRKQQDSLGAAFAFRAEWLGDRLFSYYREPGYLREILDLKPCLLVGGRGTGKTTVLKSIAYDGKWRIERGSTSPDKWPFVGLYWRIDTNQVGAFTGEEVTEQTWTKVFAHYVNLTLCTQLVRYLVWLQARTTQDLLFAAEEIDEIAASLHIDAAESVPDLARSLKRGMARFEANINNIGVTGTGPLSLQGAPVRQLIEATRSAGIGNNQRIFFLIDEYENLLDYQQRVLNTLIKHGGELYTFKVAMKSNGHRDRRTVNERESLQEPADYVTIDIAERLMEREYNPFASAICNERVASLASDNSSPLSVDKLFPGILESEEAERLGLASRLRELRENLAVDATEKEMTEFDGLGGLHQYLVEFWAHGHSQPRVEVLRELLASPDRHSGRLANYQYAMLFTIHQGTRGINKYYCGWQTYLRMSQGNLRYLLQLVHEALRLHLESGHGLDTPVSPETQTRAAQSVGRTNLADLKGLDARGADLTKLVLSLGRVFGVMARRPYGHTPEVCQFQVVGDGGQIMSDAIILLETAAANLALIKFISNKMAGVSGETKDYDYAVHPIFAAFFEFSDRRKRRMKIRDADILGCVQSSRETISRLLSPMYGDEPSARALPDQMALFGRFYDAF